jgi:hypothetical protein
VSHCILGRSVLALRESGSRDCREAESHQRDLCIERFHFTYIYSSGIHAAEKQVAKRCTATRTKTGLSKVMMISLLRYDPDSCLNPWQ